MFKFKFDYGAFDRSKMYVRFAWQDSKNNEFLITSKRKYMQMPLICEYSNSVRLENKNPTSAVEVHMTPIK